MAAEERHFWMLWETLTAENTKFWSYSSKHLLVVVDKRKANKGRPSKFTDRDCRQIIRQVVNLRKTGGHFTCKRVRLISGLSQVSDETVWCVLRGEGFKYCHSRKKGLLTCEDLHGRLNLLEGLELKKRYLTWENFEQFSQLIKSTLENYPIEVIDKTISSMNKRIDLVIKAKGERQRCHLHCWWKDILNTT